MRSVKPSMCQTELCAGEQAEENNMNTYQCGSNLRPSSVWEQLFKYPPFIWQLCVLITDGWAADDAFMVPLSAALFHLNVSAELLLLPSWTEAALWRPKVTNLSQDVHHDQTGRLCVYFKIKSVNCGSLRSNVQIDVIRDQQVGFFQGCLLVMISGKWWHVTTYIYSSTTLYLSISTPLHSFDNFSSCVRAEVFSDQQLDTNTLIIS